MLQMSKLRPKRIWRLAQGSVATLYLFSIVFAAVSLQKQTQIPYGPSRLNGKILLYLLKPLKCLSTDFSKETGHLIVPTSHFTLLLLRDIGSS